MQVRTLKIRSRLHNPDPPLGRKWPAGVRRPRPWSVACTAKALAARMPSGRLNFMLRMDGWPSSARTAAWPRPAHPKHRNPDLLNSLYNSWIP